MHKRMGKALIRDLTKQREKEELAEQEKLRERETKEVQVRTERPPGQPKKSVSFATPLKEGEDAGPTASMLEGDVHLARLKGRTESLLAKHRIAPQTMQLNVVERVPTSKRPQTPPMNVGDSDDELESSSPSWSTRDDTDVDDEAEGHDLLEDEEFDIDTAQHHREIALEYHRKRSKMEQDSPGILSSSFAEMDGWNQPVSHYLCYFVENVINIIARKYPWRRLCPVHNPSPICHGLKQSTQNPHRRLRARLSFQIRPRLLLRVQSEWGSWKAESWWIQMRVMAKTNLKK